MQRRTAIKLRLIWFHALCAGIPSLTLCVILLKIPRCQLRGEDAERPRLRYNAERCNEGILSILVEILPPIPLVSLSYMLGKEIHQDEKDKDHLYGI